MAAVMHELFYVQAPWRRFLNHFRGAVEPARHARDDPESRPE